MVVIDHFLFLWYNNYVRKRKECDIMDLRAELNHEELLERINKYLDWNHFCLFTPSWFLDNYYEKKSGFLTKQLFKDKVIYEKPITIDAESFEGFKYESKFIDMRRAADHSIMYLEDIISDTKEQFTCAEHEDIDGLRLLRIFVNHLHFSLKTATIESNSFFNSSLCAIPHRELLADKGHFTIVGPKGKKACIRFDIKFNKLVKKLKKFYQDNEILSDYKAGIFEKIESAYVAYENLYSFYKQKCYIKGTLCLSIHPLDYLTASNNDLLWSSCFTIGQGCNSTHTIAYLNSSMTFIAYIKSNDSQYVLSQDNYWNNKILRAWCFADENMVGVCKNYPYESQSFTKAVYDFIQEISGNFYKYTPANDDYFSGYVGYDNAIAYNDGGFRSRYTNLESYANYTGSTRYQHQYTFYNDDEVFCFDCGKPISQYEDYYESGPSAGETPMCPDCRELFRCDGCGCWEFADNLCGTPQGEMLCDSCYDEWLCSKEEYEEETPEIDECDAYKYYRDNYDD